MVDAREFVEDDRINGYFRVRRDVMTAREVFDWEIRQIFERAWLYIGHESEIPAPGDFVVRTIIGRSILFARDGDGRVRAMHNVCPHRGALVCREESGNARAFQCFYHSWTFNCAGELVGVPESSAYPASFSPSEMGLRQVHVQSYRGLHFVCLDETPASDLGEFLGGAREAIDLVFDQSREGPEVIRGNNRYSIHANWKFLAENSIDIYHAAKVHRTYFQYLKSIGVDAPQSFGEPIAAVDYGNGHAMVETRDVMQGRLVAHWTPAFGDGVRATIEARRAELVERFGELRAARIADNIHNVVIFPNLVLVDGGATTLRFITPVAPDTMEVTAWALGPIGESQLERRLRLQNFELFMGPAGFGTPDDAEALELCQAGAFMGGREWSDVSRGMGRKPVSTDEFQIRAFWRGWVAQMEGESGPKAVLEIESPGVGVYALGDRDRASVTGESGPEAK